MKTQIRSHKGEIKRIYKIVLDVFDTLDDLPTYGIDNDGKHNYFYSSIEPSIDDNKFFQLMQSITVFTKSRN